jgi:hypothetical protein
LSHPPIRGWNPGFRSFQNPLPVKAPAEFVCSHLKGVKKSCTEMLSGAKDCEMMRKGIIPFAIALFSFQLTFAKDFQKSYSIPPDSQIIIQNFLGNIKLTSYKGTNIELTAYAKGLERDLIEIKDDHIGERVRIYSHDSRFPLPKEFVPLRGLGPPREFTPPRPFTAPKVPGNMNQFEVLKASVDFEIRMPQSVEYKLIVLSSLSGKVEISDLAMQKGGRLIARSESGKIELKNVRGPVEATSIGGNIGVHMERTPGDGPMNYFSTSGGVEMHVPDGINATIDMWSQSGFLKSYFPAEIREDRYGQGKRAHVKLGAGNQYIRMGSISGQVSLIRK